MIHQQQHTTAAKQKSGVYVCTFSINGRFSSLFLCLPRPQTIDNIAFIEGQCAKCCSPFAFYLSGPQSSSPMIMIAIQDVHTQDHFAYLALKLTYLHPYSRCARYGTNYSLSPLPQEWSTAWAAAGLDSRWCRFVCNYVFREDRSSCFQKIINLMMMMIITREDKDSHNVHRNYQ